MDWVELLFLLLVIVLVETLGGFVLIAINDYSLEDVSCQTYCQEHFAYYGHGHYKPSLLLDGNCVYCGGQGEVVSGNYTFNLALRDTCCVSYTMKPIKENEK